MGILAIKSGILDWVSSGTEDDGNTKEYKSLKNWRRGAEFSGLETPTSWFFRI